MKKSNPWALLPIAVFVVLYLGLGVLFEYVLGISMGFYSIPIVVLFLVALLVALSAANELGYHLSAFQIIPFLYYPFLLLISSLVFIFVIPDKK